METHIAGPAVEDVAFLTRSSHRVRALEALSERPRDRAELRVLTSVSRSTVGRTLREFEDRHWVRRRGGEYEATPLGAFVASGLVDLVDRIETERKLRDVWHLLDPEARGLTIDMVTDATITVAEPDDPYQPVHRFVSLLRETERFRFVGFELPLLEPCRNEFYQLVLGGMEAEVVDPPAVAHHVRATAAEEFDAALASGNLAVRVHDDLPAYGLGFFDDRVAIGGYTPDSGTAKVLLDTDAAEVRDWAESTYERYRRASRPLAAPAAH